MRIQGLRVRNWLRFRGEHELDLEPTTYALVAEHERDKDRSNWLGKSALVGAIRYALFGTVPRQCQTLDDAVNREEDELEVDLELSDGTYVERRRRRGRSGTDMVAQLPDDREVRDQALLEEHLGFDEETFLMTAFFEQKSMSRFVVAQPADRTSVVNGWLGMGKVEQAHAAVVKKLGDATREIAALVANRDLKSKERVDVEGLQRNIADLREREAKWKENFEQARLYENGWRSRERLKELRDELTELGQLKLRDVEPILKAAEETLAAAIGVEARAKAELIAAKSFAGGVFNGTCPVTCEECPVADQVRSMRDAAEARVEAAEADWKRADEEAKLAKMKVRELVEERDAAKRRLARIERAKVERDRLEEQLADTPTRSEYTVAQCNSKLAHYAATVKEMASSVDAQHALDRWLVENQGKFDDCERRRKALTLAAQVLGREGVQRRLTEGFVRFLERASTERLRRAGIDLEVSLVWGRETKQLAENCPECGAAFPRSVKVKRCECGARRGNKSDGKLHVELSDRSGAAEDLAGVAVQLAAAQWLREARGVGWATAVLDEPFGSLDAANRGALAKLLANLADDGFEQAIVIAHDRGVLDAMPGRIIIEADDESSRARVA